MFDAATVRDVELGTRLHEWAELFGPFRVPVRPLLSEELDEAREDAEQDFRSRLALAGLSLSDADACNDAFFRTLSRHLLARAALDPETLRTTRAPFFSSPRQVAQLTANARASLMHAFERAQDRAFPARDQMEFFALDAAMRRHVDKLSQARARYASDLCRYYGAASVREITSWQVSRFLTLVKGS